LDDNGVNTFALPDMRGRLPLGLDNMGGAAANRVTGAGATAVGNNSGSEDVNIGVDNLPEHEHDMEGESAQYYAVNQIAGALESDAIPLNLEPGGGGYAGYPSSGGIKTTADLGQALNVMNPYLALNYIIYTGQ
jgi:microcystin-dependent protein